MMWYVHWHEETSHMNGTMPVLILMILFNSKAVK
jgi:hypothetical protein